MRSEYKVTDFSNLQRGKFYVEATERNNLVLLKPEIAQAFPTSASVNKALGNLLALAKQATKTTHRTAKPAI